jgi:hypothetical protein
MIWRRIALHRWVIISGEVTANIPEFHRAQEAYRAVAAGFCRYIQP